MNGTSVLYFGMAADEYYEALLARIQHLRDEIAPLSPADATEFAYHVSREMPEEAARMLVAEILLESWQRARAGDTTTRICNGSRAD